MTLTCCEAKVANNIPGNIGVHAFQFQVQGNAANLQEDEELQLDLPSSQLFPCDVNAFIKENAVPEITPVQCQRNQILKNAGDTANFKTSIFNEYTEILKLFDNYKIPPNGTKCNWCVMVSALHSILTSSQFLRKCKHAFAIANLTSLQNHICSKIYFKLLDKKLTF